MHKNKCLQINQLNTPHKHIMSIVNRQLFQCKTFVYCCFASTSLLPGHSPYTDTTFTLLCLCFKMHYFCYFYAQQTQYSGQTDAFGNHDKDTHVLFLITCSYVVLSVTVPPCHWSKEIYDLAFPHCRSPTILFSTTNNQPFAFCQN